MIRFRKFGLADIVVRKLFGCLRNPEGTEATVYSDMAAAMNLSGEEARTFLRFVDLHADMGEEDEGGSSFRQARVAPDPDPAREAGT